MYLLLRCCKSTGSLNPFQWRYSIRIENLGEESVKLRGRHFNVFSKSTSMEHITGSGVVGKVRKSH